MLNSRNFVMFVMVAVVIFSAELSLAQVVENDIRVLRGDVSEIKESNERIEQKLQGLEDADAETQDKLVEIKNNEQKLEILLEKAEKELGQQIKDSEVRTEQRLDNIEETSREIGKNLTEQIEKSNSAVEESIIETKNSLGEQIESSKAETEKQIKNSEAKTEENFGQVKSSVKTIIYLIIGSILVLTFSAGIILFLKLKSKNVWVEVKVNDVIYEVLVKHSPRKNIWISPFKTATGIQITKDSRNTLNSSLKGCLSKDDFSNQKSRLMKEGKIREVN